jgi:hypothetical protein
MKQAKEVKLDLGAGVNKREGFLGVDILKLKGVDMVVDLTKKWPWKDNSVDEIHMSHTMEHFTQEERVHVCNEMYRVLKKVEYDSAGKTTKGFATIITPAIFADRAYGDPTHKWPAVGDWFYLYLNRTWRMGNEKGEGANAPHADIKHNKKGYSCDFERTVASYNIHPSLQGRNQEYQTNALTFWKEAAQDIIAVIIKK